MHVTDPNGVSSLQSTEPSDAPRRQGRRHQASRDAWWAPASAARLLTQLMAARSGVQGRVPVGAWEPLLARSRSPSPSPSPSPPPSPSPSPSPVAATTLQMGAGNRAILGSAAGVAATLDVLPPPGDRAHPPFATIVVIDLVADGPWSHRLERLAMADPGRLGLVLRRAAPGLRVFGVDVDAAAAGGIQWQSLSLASLDRNVSATASARAPTAAACGNLTLTLTGTRALRISAAPTDQDWTFLVALVPDSIQQPT